MFAVHHAVAGQNFRQHLANQIRNDQIFARDSVRILHQVGQSF
jgi:hypothetical protein